MGGRGLGFHSTVSGGHCRRERSPGGAKRRKRVSPSGLHYSSCHQRRGCPGGGAWIDPLPGGISGSGASEVAVAVAGGRPGSTITRMPTITRE
jgi:hypothetical protein